MAARRLRVAFSEQERKSEGVFLQITNQTHLLILPYVFLFFSLQLSFSAPRIYLLVSGSRSGKVAHEFLLPDRLGWDTGSFQSSWGKNDNTYINQSRVSYLGSLTLPQWGQIKDFASLRKIGDGPLEVLLMGFFVVLMDYTPQCWHIFSTLSHYYYYWTGYFSLKFWHNCIGKKLQVNQLSCTISQDQIIENFKHGCSSLP